MWLKWQSSCLISSSPKFKRKKEGRKEERKKERKEEIDGSQPVAVFPPYGISDNDRRHFGYHK
jgi:hypothetical protein